MKAPQEMRIPGLSRALACRFVRQAQPGRSLPPLPGGAAEDIPRDRPGHDTARDTALHEARAR